LLSIEACKGFVIAGIFERRDTCTGRPTAHALARYRCFLPDLAGLAGLRRVGPGTRLIIPPDEHAPKRCGVDFPQRPAMAATTTQTYVPIEVYLRSSYEPDAEYVDGRIEERPMGEYDHASWQEAIMKWFWQHENEWGIRVKPELRIQVSPTRFRVPDVTVLDRSRPIEQIITHPPLAVFEILSPEDTMTRIMRKLDDYAAMDIAQIWVIDPQNGKSYRFREGQLILASLFGEPGEPIHFAIEEVAKLLD
jgi:Uma2 family endonuclease